MTDFHNLDELEVPQYLDTLEGELEEDKPQGTVQEFVEDHWVGNPQLYKKSLEELEAQDEEYRKQVAVVTDKDKQTSAQLQIQKQIYSDLLDLTEKITRLHSFSDTATFKKNLKSIIKSLLEVQELTGQTKPKLKKIGENSQVLWKWMSEVSREWSSRVDLKIGSDIISQVLKEAEQKKDYSLQSYVAKELKTQQSTSNKQTIKKAKHRASKHRKLNYEVHEKLQNFVSPEVAKLEPKQETLIKTLFGKQEHSKSEKVYLDVPLV